MSSNFETLPTTLYLNPKYSLQIIRAELTSDLNIAIDLINLGDSQVNEITFEVKYKDKFDNWLFNGSSTFYNVKELSIEEGEIYYLKPIEIDQKFEDAKSLTIRISTVFLENSRMHTYNEVEYPFVLPVISENKSKRLKATFGSELITYAENTPNGWRCVCGVYNPKDLFECRNCKRNKDFVLSNLTESLINAKLVNLMSNSGFIDEKNKENMSSLTQTQMIKIAPTTDIIEKKRINKKIDDEGSNKKKTFTSIIVGLIAIVVLFAAIHFYSDYRDNRNFKEAKVYLEKGQYEEAIDLIEHLKNNPKYEISPLLEKAHALKRSEDFYEAGNKMMAQGKFIEAIKNYKQVISEDKDNYANSQNRISDLEELILQDAERYIEGNDYSGALNLLNQYLAVIDESAKAQNLKNSIIKYNSSKNTSNIDTSEEYVELEKSRAEIIRKAQSLIHTYQKIAIEKANLRTEPSLESEITSVLPKDSELYIYNTKIEGVERIWCEVTAVNSLTKEQFDGWVSSNTIEPKI
ncbi:hypothetical protein ING2D1G_0062 [Peptoniphilus sp. ING2-D1G]|nr:hypothetical protein ING2D1G_0062 [Peptoniphilus sp. ING2-D1G]